jgi:hypothetical protein
MKTQAIARSIRPEALQAFKTMGIWVSRTQTWLLDETLPRSIEIPVDSSNFVEVLTQFVEWCEKNFVKFTSIAPQIDTDTGLNVALRMATFSSKHPDIKVERTTFGHDCKITIKGIGHNRL